MMPNSFWKNCFQNQSQSYLKNMTRFKRLLNFSNGENALLIPEKITSLFKTMNQLNIHSIDDPTCKEIKDSIAKVFNVSSNMITVGNGSDEIIENIPRIFLEPGESVLTIVPTFFRLIESSLRMKGRILTIKTNKDKKFRFTKKVIKKTIKAIKEKNPKIIWLCSPNNPTGETMTLDQIGKIAKETKNLVIVDEAFQEFIDPNNKKSAIRLLKNNKNILVLKTFSKSWALGGARFGFVVGSPALIKNLEKWRLPFNISNITKEIILILLKKWGHLESIAIKTKRNKDELLSEINKLSNIEIGADSKTNIFILRHKTKNIFQELLKKNILTTNLQNTLGLRGMNFIRITVKTRKENKVLLKALKEIENHFH